jgi:hypothetical protein
LAIYELGNPGLNGTRSGFVVGNDVSAGGVNERPFFGGEKGGLILGIRLWRRVGCWLGSYRSGAGQAITGQGDGGNHYQASAQETAA